MASLGADDASPAANAVEHDATSAPGTARTVTRPLAEVPPLFSPPKAGCPSDSSGDGNSTSSDHTTAPKAAALADDSLTDTTGATGGIWKWCCSRKRAESKARKDRKSKAAESNGRGRTMMNLAKIHDRAMDIVLRRDTDAPEYAPMRRIATMSLETLAATMAPAVMPPPSNGPLTDETTHTNAFLDGQGYKLGFSIHQTGVLEEIQARTDALNMQIEQLQASNAELRSKADEINACKLRVEQVEEEKRTADAATLDLQQQLALEKLGKDAAERLAADNLADRDYFRKCSKLMERERHDASRQLRECQAGATALQQEIESKTVLQSQAAATVAALQQDVTTLKNQLKEKEAWAVESCKGLRASLEQAQASKTGSERALELKTALVRRVRQEKQEAEATAKNQASALQASLNTMRAERKKEAERLTQQHDKTQAAAASALVTAQRQLQVCRQELESVEQLKVSVGKRWLAQEADLQRMKGELQEEKAERLRLEEENARMRSQLESKSNNAVLDTSKSSDETAYLRHELERCQQALHYQTRRAEAAEYHYHRLNHELNNRPASLPQPVPMQDLPVGPSLSPAEARHLAEMQETIAALETQLEAQRLEHAQVVEAEIAKVKEAERDEKVGYMSTLLTTQAELKRSKNTLAEAQAHLAEAEKLKADQRALMGYLSGVKGELGKGGQAVLLLAMRKLEGGAEQQCALKLYKDHGYATLEGKVGQVAALTGFAPKIYDVFEPTDGTTGGVVSMELIEGKTLYQVINDGAFEGNSVKMDMLLLGLWQYFKRAAQSYYHLCHRDLKLENVMITPNGGVKIIDFGHGKVVPMPSPLPLDQQCVLGGGHTRLYMAPEALSKKTGCRDDVSVDMFAAAVMCLVCLTKSANFFDAEYFSLVEAFVGVRFHNTPLPEHLGGTIQATEALYEAYETQRERIGTILDTKERSRELSEGANNLLRMWLSPAQDLRMETLGWNNAGL